MGNFLNIGFVYTLYPSFINKRTEQFHKQFLAGKLEAIRRIVTLVYSFLAFIGMQSYPLQSILPLLGVFTTKRK